MRLFWFTCKYFCICNKTRPFLVQQLRIPVGTAQDVPYREHMNIPASVLFDHAHVLVLSEAQKEAKNWSLGLVLLSILNTAG